MANSEMQTVLKRLSIPIGISLTRDLLFIILYYCSLFDGVWDGTETLICFIVPKLAEIVIAIFIFKVEVWSAIIRSTITIVCPNLIPGLIFLTWPEFSGPFFGISISIFVNCVVYTTYSPAKPKPSERSQKQRPTQEITMMEQAESEVRAAIDIFSDGVRNGDIKAMESVIAHEPNIVFYGSQTGDKEVGWDAVRASFEEQFQETGDIQYEVLDSTISVVGDLAWAAYDLRYGKEGGPASDTFESRWTCVLHRDVDGWKMVHMHHSRGR